ncbi:MAG: hypothetical protein C5B54_00760 [Acidobacteria bacterium]|nr:MAG: hypothetical protein C5B54_00760 [Acidobacteriota bacterium]
MFKVFLLSVKEANLLRRRIRNVLDLRQKFLDNSHHDAIHDLRVGSRRLREALDYLQKSIPPKWQTRLMKLSKRVTKSLGRAREIEVNLDLLERFREAEKLHPIFAELLVHMQKEELEKRRARAIKKVSQKQFAAYEKFLSRLHGTKTIFPTESDILQKRLEEFASFGWGALNDDRLHDLRIRAKRLRYAMEIQQTLKNQPLGRLKNRIRKLQEVLGQIHDLFVLADVVKGLLEEWDDPEMKLVPAGLNTIYQTLVQEKIALYPRVYPLYSKVILSLEPTASIQSTQPLTSTLN